MPQIAGFRGVVQQDTSKIGTIEVAKGVASGALTRDPGRAIYRYHQVFPGGGGRALVRKSLVCAVRLGPWSDGTIRPHEQSSAAGRDAALAKIKANAAHTEPFVAGFHDAAGEVDRVLRRVEAMAPTLQVTTKDGVAHQLWRVQDAEALGKLRHYFAPKKLHVLEGHDRYEAMLAYQEEQAATHSLAMYSSVNYGLAYLVNLDEPALAVAPRHRIIRGTGVTSAVLGAVAPHFIVEKLAGAANDLAKIQTALSDALAHQPVFVAVFAKEPDAWKLTLRPDVSPVSEGVPVHRAVQKLDPIALQHMFLDRHLPKAVVTTDIDATAVLATLRKTPDPAELVLIVRPVSIKDIEHVDELGQRLPAGSTALFPPIAAGLVSMPIVADEDLV